MAYYYVNFKQLDRVSVSVKIMPEDRGFEHITYPETRKLKLTTLSLRFFPWGVLIKNQFKKQEESIPSLKYCFFNRSFLAGSHPKVVWSVRFRVNWVFLSSEKRWLFYFGLLFPWL